MAPTGLGDRGVSYVRQFVLRPLRSCGISVSNSSKFMALAICFTDLAFLAISSTFPFDFLIPFRHVARKGGADGLCGLGLD